MDISAANWSEDDNANTTAAPDGAPEGMAPSGVNNVLRAHQGALKRFYNWTNPKITGGSGTAFTLSYAVAPGALVDGMTHLVQFHAVNGTGATLNINSLGATPLHYHAAGAWRVAPPGLIDTDEVCRVAYHSSSGAYRLINRRNRTGEVVPFAGSTAPAGALFCYGQTVSRTTYAGLFAAISTTYGGGDGSTTFSLPDLRGRVVAGKSDMGGSDAGNLSGGGALGNGLGAQSQIANTNVSGSTAGSLSVSTTSFNMDGPTSVTIVSQVGGDLIPVAHAAHTHANVVSSGNTSGALSVSASGTSGAFGVVQPTRVLNYLIRI
jgi:microcystin-dependent protein